ncbi:oxidoreductase [Dyella solisilvae]|uniref:Oxidoreductase n=1 Tax=Dyella solisilvae TaxID=1920168 RepID=A0A370K3D6_9GAMM|nr:oxidoreductase [Dyella solisilvae]RDI97183.1 oxidoreductase [Dyella solisilvae]
MNDSLPPLRVALIGYGYAGKTFHAPLIQSVSGLELAVVASRDADKVHADLPGMVVTDVQAAITDPQISLVVIASPNDTHAPLAHAALEAGKHVVVDKPFALDVGQARELVALAERRQRVLSVFQNRRWDSDFLGVRQVLAQGLLGEVMHVESHIDRFRPQVRARWREQHGPGSGLWYDLGPHLIDQALLLFGVPERVWASMAVQRDGGEVTDWAHVVLEYGRRRVVLHAGMLVAGGSARFTLHGSRGSLVKPRGDRQEAQLLAGIQPGAPGWGEDDNAMCFHDGGAEPSMLPTPAGDQREYYRQLRDAVLGSAPNPVTPLQAVTVMAVLEAAIASAMGGHAVIPDVSVRERLAWDVAAQ